MILLSRKIKASKKVLCRKILYQGEDKMKKWIKKIICLARSYICPKKCIKPMSKNKIHFKTALLCVVNRSSTMKEHNCNEHDLFLHPSWLFKHYFDYSGVCLSNEEKIEILHYSRTRLGRQVVQAFLCITNRYMTMKEHGCSPGNFLEGKNHDLLIEHFIENGGAKEFAKRREKFFLKNALTKGI